MEPPLAIKFLGGADTVTGSKTLVETPNSRVLIDCGLFQGLKELRLKNWADFPLNPASIDSVVLTHGHLDHCGYLPRLIREGFSGPVHMTEPTTELARIILRDSAKIQEEDAKKANKNGYTKHDPAKPLYTVRDAEDAIDQFVGHPDGEWVSLADRSEVRFHKNAHILGSACVEFKWQHKTILFSGDMGYPDQLLYDPPAEPSTPDVLVTESTYGDRNHPDANPVDQVETVVTQSIDRGGNLIIPSFAVGRSQEMLYILDRLMAEERIPVLPTYLDSPMGVNVTRLYQTFSDWHGLGDRECEHLTRNVDLIRNFQRTKNVLDGRGGKIIIAGAGMLTGGRVLYYLERLIDDPRTTILLNGYQAEGTRGRSLQRGANELKFHGEYYPVNANVRSISTLSAHADQSDLLNWFSHFTGDPDRVFINHGEAHASDRLRVKIKDELGWTPTLATAGESHEIGG